MKTSVLLLILIVGISLTTSAYNSPKCVLPNYVEQILTDNNHIYRDTIKLKQLNDKEFNTIRKNLCAEISFSALQEFDSKRFKSHILKSMDVNSSSSNANEVVSEFLNTNKNKLICEGDRTSINKFRSRKQHLFKMALYDVVIELYDEILLDEESYKIDFNGYEIVDGQKETIVDYIDKLIATG